MRVLSENCIEKAARGEEVFEGDRKHSLVWGRLSETVSKVRIGSVLCHDVL